MAELLGNILKHSESVTDIPLEVVTHKWVIKKFTTYNRTETLFTTWTTQSELYGEITWTLKLRPNGLQASQDCVFFSLSWNKENINLNFLICFLNAMGEYKIEKKLSTDSYISGQEYNFFREFLVNKDNDMLPDNKLTIYCKIILKGIVVCSVVQNNEISIPKCNLSLDLNSFLENEKFSDVILSVDGKDFHAHKVILAARSPVFKAMFDHNMAENLNNRVVIVDIKEDVLRQMLRYIYTGTVENIENMAGELLAVADKYDLQRLKRMCEQAICRNLTVENAAETLLLVESLSDTLKAKAFNFIIKNAKDVIGTAAFQTIEKNYPHLLAEVFRAFFNELKIST